MKKIFNCFSNNAIQILSLMNHPPGIYSIKAISEVVYTKGNHDGTLQIEYDDISKKRKLILTRFGSAFGYLRFI